MKTKMTIVWRRVFFLAQNTSLALCLPLSVDAQGIGPPPGTEMLLWLFLAVAALFVLVLSTVLFYLGKKVLFKGRNASLPQKWALFAASVLTSCVAGVLVMLGLGLR